MKISGGGTIQTYVHNFQGLYQQPSVCITKGVYNPPSLLYTLGITVPSSGGFKGGGPEGAWAHPVIGPLLVTCYICTYMYARISNSILWSVFILKA